MGLKVVGKVVCDRCGRTEYASVNFDRWKRPFSVLVFEDVYANLERPEGWRIWYDLIFCPDCAKAFEEFMKGAASDQTKEVKP